MKTHFRKEGGHKMGDAQKRTQSITSLLNGANSALRNVVPIPQTVSKPKLLREALTVKFGVFIGITGDIKGKILLLSEKKTFGSIGEAMFGAKLEDDMLVSFSGELGNMIAGNISIAVENEGLSINITEPTIIEGVATISGFEMAVHLVSTFDGIGDMSIYLLMD